MNCTRCCELITDLDYIVYSDHNNDEYVNCSKCNQQVLELMERLDSEGV